ncbi:XRE family transcriptional regulator [Acuticoccus sp. M5D2P5]|uniref:helix-turn-helix domain-containing protein n=1 Tax=Acuticoccus kalidii TaxID=2910977 RepID=UPI001F15AB51|nr:XRE family transcriptional regulator [Acuticoccus kalidii]MCF3933392.1 XRE family transcriptional regulator [Acuticoccus kalidii]
METLSSIMRHQSSVRELQIPDRAARLGAMVRHLRRSYNLTLQQAGERSGLAPSTISKIENGHISPTYDNILRLAAGLGIDVAELFAPQPEIARTGRRAVTRSGEGVHHPTPQYDYEMLATELSKKRFTPLRATIHARSPKEFKQLIAHRGEEFFYVLSGSVELHTEHYEPTLLNPGDSAYFDSTMGHALCSVSEEDAVVLWISSHIDL